MPADAGRHRGRRSSTDSVVPILNRAADVDAVEQVLVVSLARKTAKSHTKTAGDGVEMLIAMLDAEEIDSASDRLTWCW